MPSPRRRSRDRRSRSRSPHRRPPPRRSRSRSPRRRPFPRSSRSRSKSPIPRRRSPRRSRTHSPRRRPVRRSGSRPRNKRSLTPRLRGRRSNSPRGRPERKRSPRLSPGRRNSGGKRRHSSQSPEAQRRSRSPHQKLSPNPINQRDGHSSPEKHSPSRIQHKTYFISGITVATPIRRMLLSDRFETEEQKDQGGIDIEDNIVIAIQRGPHARNLSPCEINREFNPDKVVIIRSQCEGQNPIFDREEIKVFGFDSILDENVYEEKRIISVVPSSSSKQSSRRGRSPEVIRKFKHGPEIKLDFRPDPRYENLVQSENKRDDYLEQTRIKRVHKNPNDLRHSLSTRRVDDDARSKIEAKRRNSDSSKSGRVFDRIGGRSKERRRDSDNSKERRPNRSTSDQRKSGGDRNEKEKRLPDFKNRPDKFQYDEWKEKPEMIPRNPSYFEHDNREGSRGFRGRGRGFRGRFPPRSRGRGFRGSSRGGYSGSREKESAWKHDLFDKLNEEEEEKPSSTTKN